MIFNKTPKAKAIRLLFPKEPMVRVVTGEAMDSVEFAYREYDSLAELRAVVESVYQYMGLNVHTTFGSNHFCVYVDDKEVLRIADVAYSVDEE